MALCKTEATWANGQLPASLQRTFDGKVLHWAAAQDAQALSAYAVSQGRPRVRMFQNGYSGFRPYSVQVQYWNDYRAGRGNVAAVPGTSNHGSGLACDFAGGDSRGQYSTLGSDNQRWLIEAAKKFGFVWEGGMFSPHEGWHFCHPKITPTTTVSHAAALSVSAGAVPLALSIGDDMPVILGNNKTGELILTDGRHWSHINNAQDAYALGRGTCKLWGGWGWPAGADENVRGNMVRDKLRTLGLMLDDWEFAVCKYYANQNQSFDLANSGKAA